MEWSGIEIKAQSWSKAAVEMFKTGLLCRSKQAVSFADQQIEAVQRNNLFFLKIKRS
jgi:hypothetical protein